jgi:predicted GNAT family N-acyltransferase
VPERAVSSPDGASIGGETAFRWAAGPDDLELALAVREHVFCEEQGVSRELEIDGLDDACLHLLALAPDGRRAIGTLRLHIVGEVARIGRLAVVRNCRRRGVGARLLALALARAREEGCSRARLASQLQAMSTYEKAGFGVESETFEEAGIAHVWMGMQL